MTELLIDDSGEVWPAHPEVIARRFGDSLRCRDVVVDAVALGFIFVQLCPSGVRVAMLPHFTSRRSMIRLIDIIASRNPPRVVLSDARLSSWEFVAGADRAITRIAQLVAEAQTPRPRPLITSRRQPLQRSLDIAGGQLFPVLLAWHQRQGRWERDFHERLLKWKLLPDTVIAEQPRASERLLIRHWGARHTTFGKTWIQIAPGREVEDQPNAEIGQARAAMLRETIAEGVPRLLASDLVFRGIEGELIWLKFCRLDVPWLVSDGTVLVSGTIVARRTVILAPPDSAPGAGEDNSADAIQHRPGT
jgi:hypothetical protein